MSIRQISVRTSMILAIAIALFMQSACTLHEVMAKEKIKVIWPGSEYDDRGTMNYSEEIEAIKNLNCNTIIHSCKSQSWYDRLEPLLANYNNKGIDVHVCVPRPSLNIKDKNGNLLDSYEKWAVHLANLSLKYPCLTVYNIDDFKPEQHPERTPEKVKAFMDVANRINPNLEFFPGLYYEHNAIKFFSEASPYEPVLKDGTYMWYWASYGTLPLYTKGLELYITRANDIIHPVPFITGIYPIRRGRGEMGQPVDSFFYDPDTLRKMLELAIQGSDGVAIYPFPIYPPSIAGRLQGGLAYLDKWMETYNVIKDVLGGNYPDINRGTAGDAGAIRVCEFAEPYVLGNLTVIGYQLRARSNVSLHIYDMAGRLVTSLVNRDMDAGYHRARWDTRGMAPSLYFVNLRTGENSMVKRIVSF